MQRPRLGYACALALLWVLGCALPAAASAAEIIVRRDAGLTRAERADVRAGAGVRLERRLPLRDAELVSVPAARQDQALAALNADPDVRYAAPNVRLHAAAAQLDPQAGSQWAFANIDIAGARAQGAYGAGVTVAVVDTRVNRDHEDLQGRLAPEQDFVHAGGTCAAGTVDHGTHIAGTIAATLGNEYGIAGVAPQATVLPLRALDDCGAGSLASILEAMTSAGEEHAQVVTGSFATDPLLPAGQAEINVAFADLFREFPDTLFVVAAGNEGNDNDTLPVYPCSTKESKGIRPANLICAGLTKRDDAPVCWGNTGARSVDLFAPGTEIVSTVGDDGYQAMSGTSMSAAMVAGVAALVASHDSGLPGETLRQRILDGGDPFVGWDRWTVSGRRLNASEPLTITDASMPVASSVAGVEWKSCDVDHDGVIDAADACRDVPGPLQGCPDADGDGLRDADDNCARAANPRQEDADRDGAGDACDATPRGGDPDGDGRPELDDRCPKAYATTADGCPAVVVPPNPGPPPIVKPPVVTPPPILPAVAPRITKVSVKVKPKRCKRGRKCRRAARVRVQVSRTATVTVRVERRVKKRGHWRWRRVLRRSVAATERGARVTVRGKRGRRLAKGAYRVKVTLPGARSASRRFKV